MIANHSDLITQIHSIIQKNPARENDQPLDLSALEKSLEKTTHKNGKNYSPFLNRNDLNKLEDRLERLEEQNSQLQCIIQFLFVQLTELLKTSQGENTDSTDKSNGYMRTSPFSTREKPLLTKREKDVFNLLAKGLCAKEIAKILFISETTVITHKKNLKEKFHAKNTVELISNILGC